MGNCLVLPPLQPSSYFFFSSFSTSMLESLLHSLDFYKLSLKCECLSCQHLPGFCMRATEGLEALSLAPSVLWPVMEVCLSLTKCIGEIPPKSLGVRS